MGNGVVQVKSSVERKFSPDLMVFTVYIEGEAPSREECVAEYNDAAIGVKSSFIGCGVEADSLRDGRFSIRANTETLYNRDKGKYEGYYRAKEVVEGFAYNSHMTAELPVDSDLFAKLWTALQACPAQVTFRVSFTLADENAARDRLLADAVADARAKALVLAGASGCELGGIVRINFGGMPSEFMSDTEWAYRATPCYGAPDSCYDAPAFNPEDIEVECGVYAEWELVQD